jgi:hypothetical protein
MRLETKSDKAVEKKVAEYISEKWKCDYSSMGPYSPYDICFTRNGVLEAIAEIKDRTNRDCCTFPTVCLNLDKWFSLIKCEMFLGRPAFYIVQFRDGIYFLRIGKLQISSFKISYKGRVDRGAKNDQRLAVDIPSNLFTAA